MLRLLTGWHFYNEGIKKLEPGFTSAGFLRTAKGPFAPMFRSMVPGPYGAHVDLAKPVELGTREADAPMLGSEWLKNIGSGWDEGIARLAEMKEPAVSPESLESIKKIRDEKVKSVEKYLKSVQSEIKELQHEEWRLHELREEGGSSPAPYQRDMIELKAAENWLTMQPWIAAVKSIEEGFIEESAALIDQEEITAEQVSGALAEQSFISRVDTIVTYVVLVCGICLFLGLATRVAAVVAAGFLFSLMLTQPPWAGVEMKEFFFWAIELAGLLTLAAIGAGRWAGLDGVINYIWLKALGRLPAEPKTA